MRKLLFPRYLLNILFKIGFVSRKLFSVHICMYQIPSVISTGRSAVIRVKDSNFSKPRYAKSKASGVFDNRYSDIMEDNVFKLFNEI